MGDGSSEANGNYKLLETNPLGRRTLSDIVLVAAAQRSQKRRRAARVVLRTTQPPFFGREIDVLVVRQCEGRRRGLGRLGLPSTVAVEIFKKALAE